MPSGLRDKAPMIGCGTNTFADPDDYRLNLPGLDVRLVMTGRDTFRSDVTWLRTDRLWLVRVVENAPRVAFVAPAPASVYVSFPLHSDPQPVWNGVRLSRGEIVLHGRGEPFHQLTFGTTRWGLIALAPEHLRACGQTLIGDDLTPPRAAKFLRPSSTVAGDLLRLHTQACDRVRSRPDLMARREIARSLEHDLIHALVSVLALGESRNSAATRQRHAAIMVRLERVLALQASRQLSTAELCSAVGAPERTLRMCCTEFVGSSPVHYARLRRLNLVRSALMRSDPATASIAAIARSHGFSEPGRFAAAYRTLFGEAPSITLRRSKAGGPPRCNFADSA
ncbi:AraC family transcriptional regulator [Enhydrobacter sp.]|jgi:AraC-like DNA-binding protein|uniref:AraC family transcriptional regulator n=1 Tax=Enhydrobacter sp. TaxID=1894999 RepID=UPI0026160509|nr:AraC family transcriptional regulator [Enhydrobacter sp.]